MIEQAKLEAAALAIDEEAHICADWDDLVQTRETVADFIAARGEPNEVRDADNGLKVNVWHLGRKTLAVVDCGDARAALHM